MAITVGTTALATKLTTLETLKERLGISSSVTGDDRLLNTLIDEATSCIEDYLDRPLSFQIYSETIGGRDGPWLMVSRVPVEAITSVITSTSSTALDSSGYSIEDSDIGLIFRQGDDWPWHARWRGMINASQKPGDEEPNITVAYAAGYKLPSDTQSTGTLPLPKSIERAALITARHFYKTRRQDSSVKSVRSEDFAVEFRSDQGEGEAGDLPDAAKKLLDPYWMDL
jgi:hypothetical protein